jgi:hypothetical protein
MLADIFAVQYNSSARRRKQLLLAPMQQAERFTTELIVLWETVFEQLKPVPGVHVTELL